jgi:2-oxoglutaroyl-CoA hydrolase
MYDPLDVQRLRLSDDFREGVEAFHAKRKAVFRGT